MLTEQQKDFIIGEITQKVNKHILRTFLGKFALRMIINQVDSLLSQSLPPDIYDILSSSTDGLSNEEIQHLKDVLPSYILSRIHNPILHSILAEIIDAFVDVLVQALNKGQSLPKAA
ncbi:MAG: hypothetical protein BGO69_01800 [Bacteroidetes bacterium 46-16]|nr:MAG: hypothetical protein BGO69_01800 [Bacteroidetes bacterium 46-16]